MANYYATDPTDPDAPVALSEYQGIRPGDAVAYDPTAFAPLPGPLTVAAIYEFRNNGHGGWVTAILNDGEWEVNPDNLRRVDSKEGQP